MGLPSQRWKVSRGRPLFDRQITRGLATLRASQKVNELLETSVNGVYAIGDATGGWMLSHASSALRLMRETRAITI